MARFGRSTRLGRVLVLGGARSGKSVFAESLVGSAAAVDYVATHPVAPDDPDWANRVAPARHRRPPEWTTIETRDIVAVLTQPGGPALIDSLTAWLTVVLDESGATLETPGWRESLDAAVGGALMAWRSTQRPVVMVSDDMGSGLMPTTVGGRLFRDALGLLNQEFAASADTVWLVTAGLAQRLK